VVNLTHELGLEYAKDKIRVNAICPGFFVSRSAGDASELHDRQTLVLDGALLAKYAPVLTNAPAARDAKAGVILLNVNPAYRTIEVDVLTESGRGYRSQLAFKTSDYAP
jgi:short-subunit dehydrogenase